MRKIGPVPDRIGTLRAARRVHRLRQATLGLRYIQTWVSADDVEPFRRAAQVSSLREALRRIDDPKAPLDVARAAASRPAPDLSTVDPATLAPADAAHLIEARAAEQRASDPDLHPDTALREVARAWVRYHIAAIGAADELAGWRPGKPLRT
jgi:CHAD domain-containing protein